MLLLEFVYSYIMDAEEIIIYFIFNVQVDLCGVAKIYFYDQMNLCGIFKKLHCDIFINFPAI